MRILITNDDGINAPGLKSMEHIARTLSEDVWIVAPEHDQSAVSHSLTIRTPFRITELSTKKYSVLGTPTDCILSAIQLLVEEKPDLVLSGVNNGSNLAEDITYSGTVAAALEATQLGIPAIAFSLANEMPHSTKWTTAEYWGPIVIDKILKNPIPHDVFINVNFPDVIHQSVEGIRITHQGKHKVLDNICKRTDPRGIAYYWIGTGIQGYNNLGKFAKEGTDVEAIVNRYISITPISIDMTDHKTLELLKEQFS